MSDTIDWPELALDFELGAWGWRSNSCTFIETFLLAPSNQTAGTGLVVVKNTLTERILQRYGEFFRTTHKN